MDTLDTVLVGKFYLWGAYRKFLEDKVRDLLQELYIELSKLGRLDRYKVNKRKGRNHMLDSFLFYL